MNNAVAKTKEEAYIKYKQYLYLSVSAKVAIAAQEVQEVDNFTYRGYAFQKLEVQTQI